MDQIAQLEALRASHRIFWRFTAWTEGCQGGAYVLIDKGWSGNSGPWRKTMVEALDDALKIARNLARDIEEQEKEKAALAVRT